MNSTEDKTQNINNIMDRHKQYLPLTIYKNLQVFLKSRKLDLVSGSIKADKKEKAVPDFLDDQTFIKDIQYFGYILLEARDAPDKDRRISNKHKNRPVRTYIALLDLNSTYSNTSQDYVKLLNRIPGFDSVDKDYNLDIITISHADLSIHIMKKIDASISEGSDTNGFTHIHAWPYRYFTSIRPNHKLVAEHRILSKAEEEQVLRELYAEKADLPKIKKSEVICIWKGAEIGDVIEVKFISESSGYATKYLLVR